MIITWMITNHWLVEASEWWSSEHLRCRCCCSIQTSQVHRPSQQPLTIFKHNTTNGCVMQLANRNFCQYVTQLPPLSYEHLFSPALLGVPVALSRFRSPSSQLWGAEQPCCPWGEVSPSPYFLFNFWFDKSETRTKELWLWDELASLWVGSFRLVSLFISHTTATPVCKFPWRKKTANTVLKRSWQISNAIDKKTLQIALLLGSMYFWS